MEAWRIPGALLAGLQSALESQRSLVLMLAEEGPSNGADGADEVASERESKQPNSSLLSSCPFIWADTGKCHSVFLLLKINHHPKMS